MLIQGGKARQDATANHPGGAGRFQPLKKHIQAFECPFQIDSPEATDHAGYHHIQDNKLLQFHLLLRQPETNIC